MNDGILRERDERGHYIVPWPNVDVVAKQIALTTMLTFQEARDGLTQLMERGATVEQAETIVRLGVAPVAAELLDRMADETMRDRLTATPTCRRLSERVMTTADWLAKHRDHGDLGEAPFEHPSGTWRWLTCSCGAKQLTDGKS